MFENEISHLRILSNIAHAQGLNNARDRLRLAEADFRDLSEHHERTKRLLETKRPKKAVKRIAPTQPETSLRG